VPAAGAKLTMADGAAVGEITSAAELPLAAANRIFALGMIRDKAELLPQRRGPVAGDLEPHNQPLTYTVGTATGSARILAAPPILNPESIGNLEP